MKKVAIIILNWNGKKDTLECLSSIESLSKDNSELLTIVVDNASVDNSKEAIKNEFKEVTLLENKENSGFAKGNNIGFNHALKENADYILILNNDTLLEKNSLKYLLASMEEDKTIGMISPKIYFAPGFEFHQERYSQEERGKIIWYAGGKIDWNNMLCSHRGVDDVDKGQYDTKGETDFISGCCFLISKEVLEKVGTFDEKYFMYWEDVDLCLRVRKAGWKLIYEPKSIVWHKNARSSGRPGTEVNNYYLTRNRLLFGMRFAAFRTKFALCKEALQLLKRDLPGERRAILDFLLGRFGKAF